MNETNNPYGQSDVPWTTSDPQEPAPDMPMLQGSEKGPEAAAGLLENAAHGAHDTIDRLEDRAEPAVRELGESVSAAAQTLHEKTDQLRETRHEWAQSVRSTVRGNPLASLAAALALGAVIARITR